MGSRIASIFLRQTSRTGSFITVCLINMLLNFRWSIPVFHICSISKKLYFPFIISSQNRKSIN